MNFKYLILGLLLSASLFSCTKETPTPTPPPAETGAVLLKFDHGWGPSMAPFALNQGLVHPMTGDSITFTQLNYYVSNVKLQKADGSSFVVPNSYHLVRVPGSPQVDVLLPNIPVAEYSGITFNIGVDSARNVSGVQEGALSPSNGMFWSWNTGYIFVKAEGTSPQAANGQFAYHLGGFSGEHNAIRTVTLPFNSSLRVVKNAEPSVHFNVNAARFWHGGLRLADLSIIHMPGANAALMATNFQGAFSVDHVHN
jgi:hypothetical protein